MGDSPGLVRRSVAWALTSAGVLGALTVMVDVAVVRAQVAARAATLAAGLADGATLAAIAAAAAAPIAGVLEIGCRRIAQLPTPRSRLWVAVIGAFALATAVIVAGLPSLARPRDVVVLAGFVGSVSLLAVLSRAPRGRRLLVAGALFGGSLLADLRLTWLRPAYRDLLGIVVVCAAHAMATPLRQRIARSSRRSLVLGSLAVAATASAALLPQEDALVRWRRRSAELGRFQPMLRQSMRSLWDADLDGYSPAFGGGDCDDFDPSRQPRAVETTPGQDRNCNGQPLPAAPTAADRGLAPAAGSPVPVGGPLDRFVLVTIDCLRADALTATLTPNLWALAERGVRMTRTYAAGSKTALSLPLIQATHTGAPPLAHRLAALGVHTAATLGFGAAAMPSLASGFDVAASPDVGARWDAESVTDRALQDLDRSGGRQYTWLHYYDLHDPLSTLPGDRSQGPLPGEYVRQLGVLDGALGRLLRRIVEDAATRRTAILITADHGEAFGAHGIPFHAGSPYEALTHVPSVFVAPGIPPGTYAGLTSHRDIPPTVLAAFGANTAEDESFGRSWFRLEGAPDAPLHLFVVSAGSSSGTAQAREWVIGSIVEGRRKLIERYDERMFMLFDPVADPDEEHDLSDAERETTARLRRSLATFRDLDP